MRRIFNGFIELSSQGWSDKALNLIWPGERYVRSIPTNRKVALREGRPCVCGEGGVEAEGNSECYWGQRENGGHFCVKDH